MPNDLKEKLRILLSEGQLFNYSNFSDTKGIYDYPESYSLKYISWKTRVKSILGSEFGRDSPICQNYQEGEHIRVLGNDQGAFNVAHGYFLGALQSAVDVLEFTPPKKENKKITATKSSKIFVVHGHDDLLKGQVESLIKDFGLEPVILHREADEGRTIIEKFEKHSDVGFAIILLTPDDIGYPTTEESKVDKDKSKEFRSRQNVIFEFGYFVGKLGRNRVCCLYKENVTLPTDLGGVVYKKIRKEASEVALPIIKDLKALGYQINL